MNMCVTEAAKAEDEEDEDDDNMDDFQTDDEDDDGDDENPYETDGSTLRKLAAQVCLPEKGITVLISVVAH